MCPEEKDVTSTASRVWKVLGYVGYKRKRLNELSSYIYSIIQLYFFFLKKRNPTKLLFLALITIMMVKLDRLRTKMIVVKNIREENNISILVVMLIRYYNIIL